MFSRIVVALLTGWFFVPTIQAQPPAKPRTDFYGDPLPEGAIARLGTLRLKHISEAPGIVKAIFSPDGKWIASIGTDMRVRLWDAQTGKEVAGPWGSDKYRHVNDMAFSPDGKLFVTSAFESPTSGPDSSNITLREISTAKPLHSYDFTADESGTATAFADGGKTLLIARHESVLWRDVTTGKLLRSQKVIDEDANKPSEAGMKYFTHAFSANGKYLAIGVWWFKKGVRLAAADAHMVDLVTGKELWRIRNHGDTMPIRFAFSDDAKKVALCLGWNKVELLETVTGKVIGAPPLDAKKPLPDSAYQLALSGDGHLMAISTYTNILLWDVKEPTKLRTLIGRPSFGTSSSRPSPTFSPDGKTLLVTTGPDLQLYDVATFKELTLWHGHRGRVNHVHFSDDGTRLYTNSYFPPYSLPEFHYPDYQGDLLTWDVAIWKPLRLTVANDPPWLNFGTASPNNEIYTGKGEVDRLKIFDIVSGKQLGQIQMPLSPNRPGNGCFTSDGRFYLLPGMDKQGTHVAEYLFSAPSGKFLCKLPPVLEGLDGLPSATFTKDGRLVALFSERDGRIDVYDTATGNLRHKFGEQWGDVVGILQGTLAFSDDGERLASWSHYGGNDAGLHVWQLETGRRRSIPLKAGQFGGHVSCLAWSPDGRMLAVVEGEGDKIRIWELSTMELRHTFTGHAGAIHAIAFSPDGRLLASGSADTTVLIWDVWGR